MKIKWALSIILSLTCSLALLVEGTVYAHATTIHTTVPSLTSSDNQPEEWVTVFVHGIMSIQPHLTLHNLMRFIRDDVQDTIYSKTVEYMRQNPYFYLNQAMQEFGLKKIDIQEKEIAEQKQAIAGLGKQL